MFFTFLEPCPTGWTFNSDFMNCYFHETQVLDFDSATLNCQTIAGPEFVSNQFSLHSDAEKDFVIGTCIPIIFLVISAMNVGRHK